MEDKKMTIHSINGANTQTKQLGINQGTDSYSRNIQKQISNAQKQLQELSSNENMTLEEKMEKRQEIQQQISDLTMQLRQYQAEQRKEKQQATGSSMNDMLGGTRNTKAENKSNGISKASMTAMISAGTSIKQAKVQGSMATKMEGRAGVLESEIKMDKSRGNDTQKKEEELAKVEQKARDVTSSQISTLADTNKLMKEAAKKEVEDIDIKNKKETEKNVSDTEKKCTQSGSCISTEKNIQLVETTINPQTTYQSIDIRL